jgi:hypothetical protein
VVKAANELTRRPKDDGEAEPWAILKLTNKGNGVPYSIVVGGAVKCLACEGYATELICQDCRASIRLIRSAGNAETLRKVIEFFEVPGMLKVIRLLTDDVVADLMMKRIEDARNRD